MRLLLVEDEKRMAQALCEILRLEKYGESLWESEEVYDFIICTVSPMEDEYQPAEPVLGFLYPAFSDRSPDQNRVDIYHANPDALEEGLLYKITGRV